MSGLTFAECFFLTAAALLALVVVGCIVVATVIGVYEPLVATLCLVGITAVVAAIAAVVRWLVER
jgi:hypothetical protein